MSGHSQSIKQIKFDPHTPSLIASCSYDFTVRSVCLSITIHPFNNQSINRLWNTDNPVSPLYQTIDHHKEFTYSIDFSLHKKGLVSTCTRYHSNTYIHFWQIKTCTIISYYDN